jgi:hypothetical protein
MTHALRIHGDAFGREFVWAALDRTWPAPESHQRFACTDHRSDRRRTHVRLQLTGRPMLSWRRRRSGPPQKYPVMGVCPDHP